MSSTGSTSRKERAALAELLQRLGPDAPTLCAGWNTSDLAAHLIAREYRPDSAPGFVLRPLLWHSENVRASYLDRPYEELVELLRTGPPKWSPLSMPKFEAAANTAEFFVHHEDVRRAQNGWTPRSLSTPTQDDLWRALVPRAKLVMRSVGCGVVLQRSDIGARQARGNTSLTAKSGQPGGTVTGEPQELLLFAYGRRAHAQVKISGGPVARSILENLSLEA
jgi:uncharacterized protein (TIGR03085 family)